MEKKSTYQGNENELTQLAQRLAAGDEEAIELIYRAYFRKLLYYGIQVAGRQYQHEAEDVIQEFFIWLSRNGEKAGKIRDFEAYLFQSIRRNLLSRLSADKNAQNTFDRYVSLTTALRESADISPEQLQIAKEEGAHSSALIRQELDKLPPYQREALYLRYFEDKSYPEISAILSVSEQVAYNYVSRAIKRLKQQLTDLAFLFFSLCGLFRLFC